MGPENTSSLWVCLCVPWEVAWLIMGLKTHPESESVFVFFEMLHDWSWDLKTHPGSESVSVFSEKLHDWSWDLNTSSLWVCPEKLHDWSLDLKAHSDSESVFVLSRKLVAWLMCSVCEFKFFFHTTLIKSLIFFSESKFKGHFRICQYKVWCQSSLSWTLHNNSFTLETFTCHVCWSVWFLFNVLSILIALFPF